MTINAQKHENRLKWVEDHIGRSLAQSEASGELRLAKSFGKPLEMGDGYAETPEDLRMGYKILKDAGYVPAEVELMKDIEILRRSLEASPAGVNVVAAQKRLSEMRLQLALRLEQLKSTY